MDGQRQSQQPPQGNDIGYGGYALGGRIMLSAIVVLFVVVVFMSALHLYARWYFLRLRRRRRHAGTVLLYADNQQHSGAPANTGLDREVLNSLPFYAYGAKTAEPECAVCLAEFEEKEILRLLPKCGHSFHIQCIDMWLYSHSTCPLCRSRVELAADPPSPVVAVEVQEEQASSSSQSEPVHQEETNRESSSDATSSAGKRKTTELRIDVGPLTPRRPDLESDLPQSSPSPGTRFLYFKRLLSINRRSPVSTGTSASPRPCTGEVDLEAGTRVDPTPTPR